MEIDWERVQQSTVKERGMEGDRHFAIYLEYSFHIYNPTDGSEI